MEISKIPDALNTGYLTKEEAEKRLLELTRTGKYENLSVHPALITRDYTVWGNLKDKYVGEYSRKIGLK